MDKSQLYYHNLKEKNRNKITKYFLTHYENGDATIAKVLNIPKSTVLAVTNEIVEEMKEKMKIR